MGLVLKKMRRINAKFINHLYIIYQLFYLYLSGKQNKKILFSEKEDWHGFISKWFRFTPYEITFSNLAAENFDNYDLIVPLTINDLKYLNESKNKVKHSRFSIPSTEIISLCDDKYTFNQCVIDNGFGGYIPRMGITQSYPYVLKKRIDEWGANTHIITHEQQEKNFAGFLNNPEYFTQELIPGPTEYATHIFFKDHKIVRSINIEYAFDTGMPIKGKDSMIYSKICSCSYLDLFSSILLSLNFEGLCCVNYKVRNNCPYIIEINPRFGGSLCPYFFSFVKDFN